MSSISQNKANGGNRGGGYSNLHGSDNKWAKNAYGDLNKRLHTGKFSKEESHLVRAAVEDFCAAKQISVARLCSECDHKAELKGAWMEISKRLPHRSVQSVYRHGLRILHPFKRGAWTEDECDMLVDLVQRSGKKWASIQVKLNRSADSCRDKYREMGDDLVKGRWKENETELLKRLIREHLNANPTADIKELGKLVESEGITIPWTSISKRIQKRSRLSCFKKWQKITGINSGCEPLKNAPKEGEEETNNSTLPSKLTASKQDPPTESSVADPTLTDVAVSGSVTNPVPPGETNAAADFDLYLLSELSSLGAARTSDVSWESLRLENAHERWNELLEEWQANNAMEDSVMDLPVSELAQLMLDRKTSAQRAAETVEAVDLPPPEQLNTRPV